mmetsp:Transcript_55756/g.125930  ORF Transcript_55756/g.125930 Transcript_55756/m.125930 type:complete len:466 (+) Transcript_55756:65-1462(+)
MMDDDADDDMAEVILDTSGESRWQCACGMPTSVHVQQSQDRLAILARQLTQPVAPFAQEQALTFTSASATPLKDSASQEIDRQHDSLRRLCKDIWEHPEVAYEENRALRTLSDFIASTAGTPVQDKYLGLETSFRTEFGTGFPKLLICCEYDALPEIGHACGHNLIATVAVSTFLGLKKAMESSSIPGTVVLLGTPAEEAMGGKQELINRGALEGVDCAMMAHPAPGATLYVPFLALTRAFVTFKGRSAHASAAPWAGINALDAMLVAFHGISAARQQMKPTWRVHGVITNGGLKPNIIPDLTEAEFAIRAPDNSELADLKRMIQRCFDAAAMATGCDMEVEWCSNESKRLGHEYSTMKYNGVMNEIYRANAAHFGRRFSPKVVEEAMPSGSTDMGNISHVVPSIHPNFRIRTKFPNHHVGFTEAAGSPEALDEAVLTSKILAMTALDLFTDAGHLTSAREEFLR